MIVLDTHVLIWWRSAPSRLSAPAQAVIRSARSIGVSAISCWETAMLVSRGLIALDREVDVWLQQALADIAVVDVTCDVAAAAGSMDVERFLGDPADRLILATARDRGAQLVTADRALLKYAPDDTIW